MQGQLTQAAFMLILRRISVLKRWFKTPIQNAVHESMFMLPSRRRRFRETAHCSRLLFKVNRKGVYMTSFKRGYMILRSMRFALTTIVNAHFWAVCLFYEGRISVLKRWFKTPIKRRSREYCLCFPREEDDFVSMHCALFEAIVRAQVNRKGVYMTSFKHGYMWFCVHASTRISVLL